MAFSPEQKKSLVVGLGLLLTASGVIVVIWLGTYLPGGFGEFFSILAGIMWTPVLLDISLFLIGLTLVLWLNKRRLDKEGDEYVYLEQVEGPNLPGDLPQESRSAVYSSAPEKLTGNPACAAIEGALSLGDLEEATRLLLAISPSDLEAPDVLGVRIQLAEQTDRQDEADSLRNQLKAIAPEHPLVRP